ncbi:MAG TPA: sensor histidine kinase [Ktedonobacteraceae bacterium]
MGKSENTYPGQRVGDQPRFRRLTGLQARMTISYVWVTVIAVILLESLNAVFLTVVISSDAFLRGTSISRQAGMMPYSPGAVPFVGAVFAVGQILLLAPLIGGGFGIMTTRGLVRRVRHLVTATTQFANGQYAQRVIVTRNDEIGQLEYQFNRMAEQLAESIAQREMLAEQNARLAERARISRELHDAISQDLFSLRMATGGLQTALAPCAQGLELQPYVETLQETTTRMIREMRALLLELRPGQLEHLGLAAALEELTTAYRTRLGITVTTDITPMQLDAKTQHALLRIAQEAFTNAVRHADATALTLCLRSLPHAVEFIITDNGKGFEVAELEVQHGLGLRLMKERAQELHGTFSLSTTPGGGTHISICLPQENLDD